MNDDGNNIDINIDDNDNKDVLIGDKKKKNIGIVKFIPYIFILAIIVVVCMLVFPKFFFGDGKDDVKVEPTPTEPTKPVEPTPPVQNKFKVFDTSSNKRPYAVVVNNTPVAVKVQEGLNKAYIVYEIPTEGYTSRLLAVYKDVNDVTVGTIRSCRHNFADFAYENDAILVCFGWSHYAKDELTRFGSVDFMNGNEGKWSSAFWRNNPEKLATEHTAYTSLSKLIDYTTKNKYRITSDSSQLLNYSAEEIDLGSIKGSKTANTITLPYGNITTKFTYDTKTKMYTRVVNGSVAKDHKTKEPFTTKNIIIHKVRFHVMPDKYYWELTTTGTGTGYYVTNGKYVPITWKKEKRSSKVHYYYSDGTEIKVNDGRTYIQIHTTAKTASIN